jgi:putative ABC transport system permease protein
MGIDTKINNSTSMLKNYFKTALRTLQKNKLSAFINIGGLAVGMAVAMLIACWIYYEVSYDRNIKDYDRIAQVVQVWAGSNYAQKQLPAILGDELKLKFGSDFKRVVRSSQTHEHVFAYGEKKMSKSGNFIEPEGLNLLSVQILKGDHQALKDPYSILLSSSLAKNIFADADPIGKIVKMDDTVSLKVTGVYQDFANNSSFKDVTFFSPWDLYATIDPETKYNGHSWDDNNWLVYVQLADNADIDKIAAKIKPVKAVNDPFLDAGGHNINTTEIFLQPISRWHLFTSVKSKPDEGQIQYVRLFGWIGACVLLLACINFMNLSTARSEKRAKEVGIRKVIGSMRGQLIGQFFSESLVVAFFAFIIAVALLGLSLPFFNNLAETNMTIPWANPIWWIACISFCLMTGLIAGSYPALYLSSFKPIKVLKGIFRMGRLASLPRKILVVTQFTVSIIMIVGTIIIFRQVQFGKERPVGYNRDGLLMMQTHTKDIHTHFDAFRTELLATGAVDEVAESVSPVTESWPFNGGLTWSGHAKSIQGDGDFSMRGISKEYAKTIGLQFTQGRDFRSGPNGSDNMTMLLNEPAAMKMGLKDPVGKTVTWMGMNFTVIGVVKNVVMNSPYESPIPSLFYLMPYQMPYLTFRLNSRSGTNEAVEKIRAVVAKFSPGEPFDYKFVDQTYDYKFRSELHVGQLAGLFTALAIFISCLGLFGLASFVAEQRTKEIGVRKVLGANVFTLWKLLSKDFVVLVCISCLIAIPLSSTFLTKWLQQFEYRTTLQWWIFIVAAFGAIIITLATVSYQSIKAALSNPVKSLRTE